MSFLAPLAQMAGAGVQAGGAIAAGRQAQAVGRFNAQVDAGNAAQATAAGNLNAAITGQQVQAGLGRAAAAFGAGGVSMSGSPLSVMSALAAQGSLREQLARYTGQVNARADTLQGEVATAEGNAASTAGFLKAGGTLLTGAGQFAQATKALGWWGGGSAPGTSPAG